MNKISPQICNQEPGAKTCQTYTHICTPAYAQSTSAKHPHLLAHLPILAQTRTLKGICRNLLNLRKHKIFDFHKMSYEERTRTTTKKDLDSHQTFEANNKNDTLSNHLASRTKHQFLDDTKIKILSKNWCWLAGIWLHVSKIIWQSGIFYYFYDIL